VEWISTQQTSKPAREVKEVTQVRWPDPVERIEERPPTRSEDLDAVLEILTNAFNGDASNRQLVEAFTELHRGTSTQSMGRWLGRLQEDGHVETYGNGNRARWRILDSPQLPDEER